MKIFGILLMTTLFLSCSSAQEETSNGTNQTDEGAIVTLVDNSEFKKLMKKEGAQLVDVRTPGEIANGKIADAKEMNINDANFKENLNSLDKEKPVLVYCASGRRSARAVSMMKSMGFKEIHELRGGYNAWLH